MSPRFLSMTLRSAALATAVLLSACGGQETSAADEAAASTALKAPPPAPAPTVNFTLIQADTNVAAPFGTCQTSSGLVEVDAGKLAVTGSKFTATFTGVENGAAAGYQASGTLTTKGTTLTFVCSGTTFTGSVTNGVLTATGNVCGGVHTLVFQQQ
jgi:hypothetical protein